MRDLNLCFPVFCGSYVNWSWILWSMEVATSRYIFCEFHPEFELPGLDYQFVNLTDSY